MAKLEEVLPEIRKGRLFRPSPGYNFGSVFDYSEWILKDQWELAPKIVTREDFERAWDTLRAVNPHFCDELQPSSRSDYFKALCKELGL